MKNMKRNMILGNINVKILLHISISLVLIACSTERGGRGQKFPANSIDAKVETIDSLVVAEMGAWKIPGLALGIIVGDEIILAKGFGYRDSLYERVSTKTNFMLASMTKAFTAVTIGLLVDDNIIDWETPITEQIPEFSICDSVLNGKITYLDLLSHRTGLAAHDELWASGDYLSEEIFEHLDELEVLVPYHGQFEYNNVLYIAAADMVKKLIGQPWITLGRTRILSPLNMNSTGFSVEELLQSKEYSFSFDYLDDTLVQNEFPGPEHNAWYYPRGSGSMFSNIDDLCHWMFFQLNAGDSQGIQIVSKAIVKKTHEPQIVLNDPPFYINYPEIEQQAYGLGWFLDEYRGHQRIHHGGASMGYSNYITLFPNDGVGIVILSNRQTLMPVELMYFVSDVLLELPTILWRKLFAEFLSVPS